jgi:hypothetical protein
MPTNTKGEQVRVYLQDSEIEALKTLAERTELAKTDLCTRLLAAALRCVKSQNYRLKLPVAFDFRTEGEDRICGNCAHFKSETTRRVVEGRPVIWQGKCLRPEGPGIIGTITAEDACEDWVSDGKAVIPERERL